MKNPFRQPMMRLSFAGMVKAYEQRSKLLFHEGRPIRSNSAGIMFWRGYEGTHAGAWDRASKDTLAYACWKAGVACRGVDGPATPCHHPGIE